MRGSVAKGRLQCQERAAFASGVGRTKTAFLEGLEGFGGFDGWQAASLNAKKKLLGWAMGFGAFACGVRGPKMHLEGLEFL